MANKPNNTKVSGAGTKARGRGFYIAMYSGLAGLLVLAVAIGYNSLLRPDVGGDYATVPVSVDYGQDSVAVSGTDDRPVVNIPHPTGQQAAEPGHPYDDGMPHLPGQTGVPNQPGQPNQPNQPGGTPPAEAVPLPGNIEGQPPTNAVPLPGGVNQPAVPNEPGQNQQNQQQNQGQNQQEAQATPPAQNAPDNQQPAPSETEQPITLQELLDVVLDNWDDYFVQDWLEDFNVQQVFDPAAQTFTAFNDSDDMHWPVLGDIVMDFSMDSHVFDPTLDQWRVNDSISISAGLGDAVRAAADGRVQQVQQTPQFGQVVVIDHGNGWTTTYRQLATDVAVAVGDVVSRGQIIGNVGQPSIFAGGLGYHLTFNVHNDGDIVNPHAILSVSN